MYLNSCPYILFDIYHMCVYILYICILIYIHIYICKYKYSLLCSFIIGHMYMCLGWSPWHWIQGSLSHIISQKYGHFNKPYTVANPAEMFSLAEAKEASLPQWIHTRHALLESQMEKDYWGNHCVWKMGTIKK